MWSEPVGEGANRVTTGVAEDIGSLTARLGGRLSTWIRGGPTLVEEVVSQRQRWRLWAPVMFGLGAAGYMGLTVEPALGLMTLLGLAAIAAVWVTHRLSRGGGWFLIAGS